MELEVDIRETHKQNNVQVNLSFFKKNSKRFENIAPEMVIQGRYTYLPLRQIQIRIVCFVIVFVCYDSAHCQPAGGEATNWLANQSTVHSACSEKRIQMGNVTHINRGTAHW